jgi:hypothetical protein
VARLKTLHPADEWLRIRLPVRHWRIVRKIAERDEQTSDNVEARGPIAGVNCG